MMVKDITTKALEKEVIKSKKPIFVECWASWCLPCKQVDHTLRKMVDKYGGKCKIYKINVDRNPVISRDYNVKGLPTFMAFLNGKEVERKTGSLTDKQIESMIIKIVKMNNKGEENKSDKGSVEKDEDKVIEDTLKDLGYL